MHETFGALPRYGEMPTALIANFDIVALGLLLEGQVQGIPVPEQLSIVGARNLELPPQVSPALTTGRTPQRDIGGMAARYQPARING